MITKHRTKGFVFKKTDMGEADRIYSIFTEDYGRLEIFGKAIRKINSKLKNGIDIFYFSEIEFIQGKNNRTLTGAIKKKKFGSMDMDLEKIKIAHKIASVLDNFLKGQEKDNNILDLLNEIFEKLNNQQVIKNQRLIYCYFIWNFLHAQGYGSELYSCILCHNKLNQDNIYFSSKEGGLICEKCQTKSLSEKINSDVVKIIRIILKKDWQTLLNLKVEETSQKILDEVSQSAVTAFCPL